MGTLLAYDMESEMPAVPSLQFSLWPWAVRTDMLAPVAGLVSIALHLDKHLGALIAQHGSTTYAILFAIVFAETGLVSLKALSCVTTLYAFEHMYIQIHPAAPKDLTPPHA